MACYEYLRSGSCRFGESCKFAHSSDLDFNSRDQADRVRKWENLRIDQARTEVKRETQELEVKSQDSAPVCWEILRWGSCKYGERCKFSHRWESDPDSLGQACNPRKWENLRSEQANNGRVTKQHQSYVSTVVEKKPEARDYQSFKLLPRTQPLTKPNPVFETSLQKNNPNVKVSIIHNISCR